MLDRGCLSRLWLAAQGGPAGAARGFGVLQLAVVEAVNDGAGGRGADVARAHGGAAVRGAAQFCDSTGSGGWRCSMHSIH
jgi:hypothetical protein